MATYIFKCSSCDKEGVQKMPMAEVKATMNLVCVVCNCETEQKQIIKPSPIHFKGGGWPDGKNR